MKKLITTAIYNYGLLLELVKRGLIRVLENIQAALPVESAQGKEEEEDIPASGAPRTGKLSLVAAWRWWVAPASLSLILSLIFIDPFAGDWDALDYTVLAVRGQPSSMILGRGLFISVNHLLWQAAHALFNLPAEKAYLLFKYAVVAQTPLAIIACWALARELTSSVSTATVAALLLALSPYFIVYSGQVMTEIPSLLLLASALTIHLRGVRGRRARLVLAGACLLGLGANVREMSLLYAPWLVLAPFACGWRRFTRREIVLTAFACLIFLTFAFGGFAYWFAADVGGYRGDWYEWLWATRRETARHPVTISNLHPLLVYFFFVAPMVAVALPVAALKEWRERGFSPLLAMALIGLCSNLALIFHYSLVLNWRYLLTGLPALAPLVADYFMRSQTAKLKSAKLAFVSVIVGVIFVSAVAGHYAWPTGREYIEGRALAKDYLKELQIVPRDAVMIAGGQTVAVNYWRGIGAGEWTAIGTGGGWPGAYLATQVETDLEANRRVFLDKDARWWSPCGWQATEIRELTAIESRFRFRQVSDTIYEIMPFTDASALDAPELQNLLPENRMAEVKKCTN